MASDGEGPKKETTRIDDNQGDHRLWNFGGQPLCWYANLSLSKMALIAFCHWANVGGQEDNHLLSYKYRKEKNAYQQSIHFVWKIPKIAIFGSGDNDIQHWSLSSKRFSLTLCLFSATGDSADLMTSPLISGVPLRRGLQPRPPSTLWTILLSAALKKSFPCRPWGAVCVAVRKVPGTTPLQTQPSSHHEPLPGTIHHLLRGL